MGAGWSGCTAIALWGGNGRRAAGAPPFQGPIPISVLCVMRALNAAFSRSQMVLGYRACACPFGPCQYEHAKIMRLVLGNNQSPGGCVSGSFREFLEIPDWRKSGISVRPPSFCRVSASFCGLFRYHTRVSHVSGCFWMFMGVSGCAYACSPRPCALAVPRTEGAWAGGALPPAYFAPKRCCVGWHRHAHAAQLISASQSHY